MRQLAMLGETANIDMWIKVAFSCIYFCNRKDILKQSRSGFGYRCILRKIAAMFGCWSKITMQQYVSTISLVLLWQKQLLLFTWLLILRLRSFPSNGKLWPSYLCSCVFLKTNPPGLHQVLQCSEGQNFRVKRFSCNCTIPQVLWKTFITLFWFVGCLISIALVFPHFPWVFCLVLSSESLSCWDVFVVSQFQYLGNERSGTSV